MGIESDQLVYDYLSRVGDLAQQHQLSSGDRMRLVSELRERIDRQRSGAADSPGAVKRILGKIGEPAEVVRAAGGRPPGSAAEEVDRPVHRPAGEMPGAAAPSSSSSSGSGAARSARERLTGFAQRGGLTDKVPTPRTGRARATDAARPADPEPPYVPSVPLDGPLPPHLAGEEEVGAGGRGPDWWRVEPGPFGDGGSGAGSFAGFDGGTRFGPGESVPGFVGGIEVPEMLRPPPQNYYAKDPQAGAAPGAVKGAGEAAAPGAGAEAAAGGGLFGGVLRRRTAGDETPGGPRNLLLLLAAALLVGGAVLGSFIALGAGWLIAYASRRLSRAEAKWAVLGLPGLVGAAMVVWVWGRFEERWGEPIEKGRMGAAFAESWPVALKAAAVASALFLVWRARRLPRG